MKPVKLLCRIFSVLLWLAAANYYILCHLTKLPFYTVVFLLLLGFFVLSNLRLPKPGAASVRLEVLQSGCELLREFLIVAAVELGFTVLVLFLRSLNAGVLFFHIVIVFLLGCVIFWNGMLRVYLTSVQLGIKGRIIGALCGWIPVLQIWALLRIIRITGSEAAFEKQKIALNEIQAENMLCKTKYPILLVHGVFFRDSDLLNYWGRIPAHLRKNGAEIYYGAHESAASVEECGRELAARIREITEKTGCEKVNLIAHSKGGLDCRCAISRAGAEKQVASLTTINTPHRGCLFADWLLHKIPAGVQTSIARKYNRAAKIIGDKQPDFLKAVTDLTEAACRRFNEETPDSPQVYYQSVGSVMRRAESGKFPLNLSYRFVKLFSGENDGLVSVESMRWGRHFTLIKTEARGVSHGDMIDLNRENIPDFDVRDFYTELVKGLRRRGL